MSRSAAAYQKFTEDEIRKANSVDILSLARGYGYEPEKAGRKAVHMKHSGGLYIFPENNRFSNGRVLMMESKAAPLICHAGRKPVLPRSGGQADRQGVLSIRKAGGSL